MNVTGNETHGNDTVIPNKIYFFPKLLPPKLAIVSFIIVAIGLVGIVGNSLVFYLEYKQRQMKKGKPKRPFERSLTMYFIKSLALSDLLSSVIHTPLGVVWLVDVSKKTDLECKLHRIALMSLACITILNMTFISIERFLAIFFPLKAPSVTVSKVCVIIAWVLGFIIGIAHVVPYKAQRFEVSPLAYTVLCISSPPDETASRILLIFHTVIMFCIPNIILLVSAISISVYLRNKRNQVKKGAVKSSDRASAWRVKDTAMYVKIIFVFDVPYTSFFIANILKEFGVIEVNVITEPIIQLSTFILAFANCAINPIIYIMSSQDFKKVTKKLFNFSRHVTDEADNS